MGNKPPIPFLPLKDNLLCIPLDNEKGEDITKGGLYVKSKKSPLPYKRAVVLAVGPGMTVDMDNGNSNIPNNIIKGSIVIYHQAAGWDINFDDEKFVIVSWRQCETMINPDYTIWKKAQLEEKQEE